MKLKRFMNGLSIAVIILLIVAILAVVVPKLFGIQFRAVLSSSMEPDLSVGTLVVIVPTEYNDIQIGDDITFVANEQLTVVTHRVVEKDPEAGTVTTQGLANNTRDKPVLYDNVLGVVRFHIPVIGYGVIWLDPLAGKVIAFIILGALLAISLLFDSSPKQQKKQSPPPDES